MQLFIPNLTFEDDLSLRKSAPSAAAQAAVNERASAMGLMADSGDAVLLSVAPTETETPNSLKRVRFVSDVSEVDEAVQVVPFGWTDSTRQLALQQGTAEDEIPAHDAVCYVNSRAFNAANDIVVSDNESAMPFSDGFGKLCGDMAEWKAAAALISSMGFDKWVAKPAISHAGRNRLLAQGTQLNDQQSGWLRKQFAQAGYVYVEPWVTRREEWGLQFEITKGNTDDVRFIGATKLINDPVGRYLGSQISHSSHISADIQSAMQHGIRVCRAAKTAGYWGPIGIDGFRFTHPNGGSGLRLCNDINARFTMGRIALHLKSLLNPDEFAFWGHFRASNFFDNPLWNPNSSGVASVDDVRVTLTGPRAIQGRSVQAVTALLTARSEAALQQVQKLFMTRQS